MPVEGRNEQRTDQRGLTETVTIQRFVIPGWLLVSIAGLLLIYAIVAELAGFHLFMRRPWGGTVLVHRLMECTLLWTLCCTGVGWAIHLRRKRPRHQGRYWPITSLPTVTAIGASAIGLAQEYTQNYIPAGMPSWVYLLRPALLHLYMGCILVTLLWLQCRVWKRWGATNVCPVCQYDLTGNQSGICPECGTHVETESRILLYFYSRKHRWFPELNAFETAGQRKTAYWQAIQDEQRTVRWWLTLILLFVPALCFHSAVETYLGELWGGTLGTSIALAIVVIVDGRRRLRARLRQQLAGNKVATKSNM